jgi:hypothetical protein
MNIVYGKPSPHNIIPPNLQTANLDKDYNDTKIDKPKNNLIRSPGYTIPFRDYCLSDDCIYMSDDVIK